MYNMYTGMHTSISYVCIQVSVYAHAHGDTRTHAYRQACMHAHLHTCELQHRQRTCPNAYRQTMDGRAHVHMYMH